MMITAMGWQVFWKRDTSGLHHGRTMGWLGADGRSEVGNTFVYHSAALGRQSQYCINQ
jgi:hypothetical protein